MVPRPTQRRTLSKSPSVAPQPSDRRRTYTLRIEADSSAEALTAASTSRVMAPRSATMKAGRKNAGEPLAVPGAGKKTMCITPRLPSGTAGRASTFATGQAETAPEVDRVLEFTEEQKKEFAEIEGLQKMKSRRSFLGEGDLGRANKLKPIDKLQRFTVASPVVSKGKHKFFK